MRRASGVWRQLRLPILAVLAVVVLAVPGEAVGASSNLVVSQVYGGGGNAGATLKNDFIEVFNRGGSAVDLAGWSVQYASATGTGWTVTALSGSVQPGSHYLIQEAAGAGGSVELPTPDATGSISMSATAAKVALANTTTPLAGSCPSGAQIVDLVGYGTTASCFEGSGAAPAPSNTTADLRASVGCIDTDNNAADFATGAPTPRNTAAAPAACNTPPSATGAADPQSVAPGGTTLLTVSVTPGTNPTSTGLGVSCNLADIGGALQFMYDDATHGDVTAGDNVFSYSAMVDPGTTPGPKSIFCIVNDAQSRTATTSISLTVTEPSGPPLVVVSQVYGGGGNSGATYKNDFVELYNRGTGAVSLTGWSVQYASATGSTWQVTNLTSFSLQPGQYYLVQEAQGSGGSVNLPTPDATGTIAMSATAGKVALVNTTTALSGTCPTGATIADFVGYGAANCFEGSGATAAPSNTTAALRKGAGATDTNDNAADFTVGAPNPRNSGTQDAAPTVTSRNPGNGASDVAVDSNVTIGFSEPVNVSGNWYSISCGTSGAHTASVSGGGQSFTLNPDTDFAGSEQCTVTVFAAGVTDQDTNDPPDNMPADDTWSFSTVAPAVAIHDIQGAGHISPLNGQNVGGVNGIVTGKRTNGFYLQDPNPDSNDATSEGIFVFTSSAPNAVNVGDAVRVGGRVQEFRPGGNSTPNLTTTELTSPTTTVLSSGNPLPATTVLGAGGRIPPNQVIEDDANSGNVETSGAFDPASDGLDFYESLEGMRVQLNDAVAVGPTNSFGETPVVGDNGANASVRTARGGLLLRPNDANPERLVADDSIVAMPSVNVGDGYSGPLVGVIDYNFGNFFLEVTNGVNRVDHGLQRESTDTPDANQLAIATFNFENLDTGDPQVKVDALAHEVVDNLKSPDLIAGEEVQDNNGPTDNGNVDASQTLAMLVSRIQAAGGPTYEWREIDPVNDQDGGEPGGNIRQVFLFRSDRGLSFVDRPGGSSTNATGVTGSGSSTQLTFSPGRIDPANTAWNSSRKPLAGEFLYRGHKLFVIANHFNSKGGDDPLSGRFQPPTRSSEAQRHEQAHLVADFVTQLTTADPNANVVVLGDLNDFEFSDTVGILKAAGMNDLMETLPENERYSYEFEGNAQVLDHILVNNPLMARPLVFDPVHVNAEFWDQASDHDPSVVRITLFEPPIVSAGGPYSVDEGGGVTLNATGEKGQVPLTYAWDLDNNGTFETPGQSVTFSAGDGPATATVKVRVTDAGGLTAVDQASVTVRNVDPTATFTGPTSIAEGSVGTFELIDPADPSEADRAAGFRYAWACDGRPLDGATYADASPSPTVTCTFADGPSSFAVRGRIIDKDGGFTEYIAAGNVTNVAPGVTAPAAETADEGTPKAFQLGSFVDPGASLDGPYHVVVQWGDGSAPTPFDASAPGSLGTATHGYADNGAYEVKVTVTDKDGGVGNSSFAIDVANVAPTATFSAPTSVFAGSALELSLTSPHDPSPADIAAGFKYAFDCGDGYGAFDTASTASCPTADTGTRSVGGKIRDKDGGMTEYRATVQVVVTFDSLCTLTQAYSKKPPIADALCVKLRNAAAAPNASARNGLLTAYQNQVDAQTGDDKAFTEPQAAVLRRLADRLRA